MIKNIISLIILSGLFACSDSDAMFIPHTEERDPRTIHGINPIFYPYYDEYEEACGKNVDIPIDFGYTGMYAGTCTFWRGKNNYSQININIDHWESMFEGQRRWLIFHELGHCDLRLGHNDEITEYGDPVSIMHPVVAWRAGYLLDEKGYLDKLCKEGKDET